MKTPFAVNTSTRIREASFSCLSTARACALGNTQYRDCLHSTGGFLSIRSTALNGNGSPTIPMLPVWSMTTRANEPSRSRWPRQKGTVIEQSGDPVPLSHSVIHSSDWNLCSAAVAECATAEATIATSQITIPGKRLSLMIVVCPIAVLFRRRGRALGRSTACSIFPERRFATGGCKRNIEMTPLCKIEVTLPRVLGSRGVRRGGVVDEQAGVQSP